MQKWTPSSWPARNPPPAHSGRLSDVDALDAVEQLRVMYPPLVFAGEARRLKSASGGWALGKVLSC